MFFAAKHVDFLSQYLKEIFAEPNRAWKRTSQRVTRAGFSLGGTKKKDDDQTQDAGV